jgi:hypothetical protein
MGKNTESDNYLIAGLFANGSAASQNGAAPTSLGGYFAKHVLPPTLPLLPTPIKLLVSENRRTWQTKR